MAIKPILFNSHMVDAILDGRKTVMRRAVKGLENYKRLWEAFEQEGRTRLPMAKAPYAPGDVLWVRETWAQVNGVYYYRADDRENLGVFGGWCPSIHMPREAARIWLRVTNVRVERLQTIDEAGAEAEGGQELIKPGRQGLILFVKTERTAREDFSLIWDKTLKPRDRNRYGWEANPWVWVIEFERCEKPEQEE